MAQVRALVGFIRWMVVALLVVALARTLILPQAGVMPRLPVAAVSILVIAAVFLLPWQLWLTSLRGVQFLALAYLVVVASAMLAAAWLIGMHAWWPLPLLLTTFAPLLVSLELGDHGSGSAWPLNGAQQLALGSWLLLWAALWVLTLNGPGAEPQEAIRMVRITLSASAVTIVWTCLLKAQRAGVSRAVALKAATFGLLVNSVFFTVVLNAAHPWLLEHSAHDDLRPVALFYLPILIGLCILAWRHRQARWMTPVVVGVGLVWILVTALVAPATATHQLPVLALLWTALAPHRWWLAALGWTASLAWFVSAPGVDVEQVILMGLCGTAVGTLTTLLLRRLPRSAAGQPVARAAPEPMAAAPTPTPAPDDAARFHLMATVLGLAVAVLTPLLGYTAAHDPHVPYLQAMVLLGLLLGYGTYSAVHYWGELDRRHTAAANYALLQLVLSNATAGFTLYRADGAAVWANDAALLEAGRSLDEFKLTNLYTNRFLIACGAADKARVVLVSGERISFVYDGWSPAGHRLVARLNIDRATFSGSHHVLMQWENLSQEVELRAAVERERDRAQATLRQLEGILASAMVGMGMLKDRSFVWVNPAFSELLGYGQDELIGQTAEVLYLSSETYQDRGQTLYERLRAGEKLIFTDKGRCKDGTVLDLLVTLTMPHPELGETFFAFMDISEREAQARAMAQALRDAEAAAQAKEQFVSTISHELRTPLNGILGSFEILQRQPLNDKGRQFAKAGLESGKLLLCIVNDVLDFAKVNAGRLDLDPQPIRLDTVFQHAHELLLAVPRHPAVDLTLQLGAGLDATVLVDDIRLRQVLLNLGTNALKFTHSGQVRVHAACVDPRPQAGANTLAVRVTVSDSGIGMSEQTLAKLFTPFAQADGALGRKYGGTGLGLSIAQKLVEAMGSRIEVSSQLQQGSRFAFTLQLPLHSAVDQARDEAWLDSQPLKGLRVLVVDDIPTNRLTMVNSLAACGASVWEAEDGGAAIDKVVTLVPAVDLVFMDIQMPVMDGLQATRHLRAHANTAVRDVPVVAVTGNASATIRQEALDCGMNDLIHKPVFTTDLVHAARRHVAPARLAAAAAQVTAPPETAAQATAAQATAEQAMAAQGAETATPDLSSASATAALGASTPAQSRADGGWFHGRRVLVVDDSEINRALANEIVSELGATAIEAADGLEAVDLLLERQVAVDLVLMDFQMPRLDGLQATQRIRAHGAPGLSDLPVVGLTGTIDPQLTAQARAAGMNRVLVKPVSFEEICALGRSFVER
jgi:PAS domain S-box-containing protein